MGRLLVGLLLFVESALLLQFGNGRVHFLGLLLGGKRALLGGRGTVVAVLAPVREVPSTGHVVLGQPEDLEGLNQEFLL